MTRNLPAANIPVRSGVFSLLDELIDALHGPSYERQDHSVSLDAKQVRVEVCPTVKTGPFAFIILLSANTTRQPTPCERPHPSPIQDIKHVIQIPSNKMPFLYFRRIFTGS
jgi:hypothetical protein